MEETKELTLPEQARDQAKNYFRQGLNCTECVMQSFLDIHGSDLPPEVIALATVFGGGMGHTNINHYWRGYGAFRCHRQKASLGKRIHGRTHCRTERNL